jgi:uncharacterized protein
MGDDSYKEQPKFISQKTIKSLITKINNHCVTYSINKFEIIFHGGEPLLAGKKFYTDFINIAKNIILPNIELSYNMQTNAVLIDEEWCELLRELKINVGISIDGTPSSNNKNRIYHNKQGSYNDILKGLNTVKKAYGQDYISCICVIDTNELPTDVYNHFKKIGIYSVSFLFSDINYLHCVPENVPKVGEWLIEIFDLWYKDTDKTKPKIDPIEQLMLLIFGIKSSTDRFGKGINDTLVVETDGSIETVDPLKICGNKFTKTKLNILEHELSRIYEEVELARLYYNAHVNVCNTCHNCPIESVCGGGYLGHRYSLEKQFNNPSIYCKEIVKLVCHIQNSICKHLPIEVVEQTGLTLLNYQNIINYIENASKSTVYDSSVSSANIVA